jgi:hypothetical protein
MSRKCCRQHLHLQHAGPGTLPGIHLPKQHAKCVGVSGLGQAALQQAQPVTVSPASVLNSWFHSQLASRPSSELWQTVHSMAGVGMAARAEVSSSGGMWVTVPYVPVLMDVSTITRESPKSAICTAVQQEMSIGGTQAQLQASSCAGVGAHKLRHHAKLTLAENCRRSLGLDTSKMLPAVRSPCRMLSPCRYAMPAAISRAVMRIASTSACHSNKRESAGKDKTEGT